MALEASRIGANVMLLIMMDQIVSDTLLDLDPGETMLSATAA